LQKDFAVAETVRIFASRLEKTEVLYDDFTRDLMLKKPVFFSEKHFDEKEKNPTFALP
jgi:hypothetical protein